MRFVIEVDYDADPGEDVESAGRAIAGDLAEWAGVTSVVLHGEEAHVVHPAATPGVTFTLHEQTGDSE